MREIGVQIICILFVSDIITYLTRQSEMANTSPRHMPVLGNVHAIKVENQEVPMKNI